jgi:heme A synthase
LTSVLAETRGRLGALAAADTGRRPTPAFRRLAVAAVITTYLLVVAGGVVRVTGSGLGCGTTNDWPLCRGGLLPPMEETAIIEFAHRWLAATATTLVITLLGVAWLRYRHLRRVSVAASVVGVLFVVQILLGAATVKMKLPGEIVLAHLANALALLAGLLFIAAQTVRPRQAGGWVTASNPAARRASRHLIGAAAATYLLVLSGALVVADSAGTACAGWPLCGNGFQVEGGRLASLNMGHRVVAGVVAIAVVGAVFLAVRHWREIAFVRRAAVAAAALLMAQVAAGAVLVQLRLPTWTRALHLALASGLWATMALLALLVSPRALPAESDEESPARHSEATASSPVAATTAAVSS